MSDNVWPFPIFCLDHKHLPQKHWYHLHLLFIFSAHVSKPYNCKKIKDNLPLRIVLVTKLDSNATMQRLLIPIHIQGKNRGKSFVGKTGPIEAKLILIWGNWHA